jgi:hypothetical protein
MELIPGTYMLHIHRQTCTGCGSYEQLSKLYRVYHAERKGSTTHRLREVETYDPQIAISFSQLKEHTVPVCASCVENYDQPIVDVTNERKWREAVTAMGAEPVATAKPRTKTNTSVIDLADVPDF